jgi:hypothetical protein
VDFLKLGATGRPYLILHIDFWFTKVEKVTESIDEKSIKSNTKIKHGSAYSFCNSAGKLEIVAHYERGNLM